MAAAKLPQAVQTGFSSRLRLEQTSLFISTQPVVRATKRATANLISYAEIEEDYDDDDEDPSFGPDGSTGYGSTPAPTSHQQSQSQEPAEPKKVEVKRPAVRTRHPLYTEQQLVDIAQREEILVPIKLALEFDTYRITDFLMWNLNEQVLTPESFAIITCNDLELPVGYTNTISSSIKSQLAEYSSVANIQLPRDCGIHVIIHLSVNLDKELYEDKFEWDLGCDLTPEMFAQSVVKDLGISGEFYPAIAHALHDVLIRMKKEAVEGHLPQEVDNLAAFGAEAGWRVDQELLGAEWAPTLEKLSQEEIERREIERERNIRRLKRESARMGDITDIGGLFGGRSKRRRYDSPSQGGSPAFW
ncbi:Sfh1p [Sugiyamaella lignohabitans]|uniref:Sfh1p n=1 Tax=Sugiyamaella lignohabitans TaxID=796027 RepID=A0A167CQ83_9ASCO|nr:Sfh1p [Sugiyamaella lignohabitans]ANB11974.1 Sfh1p [Sugiyamaella lignohabitans]